MRSLSFPSRRAAHWVVLAAVLAAAPRGGAQDSSGAAPAPPEGRLTLEAERAVVFKDGYALLIKRATGTADAEGRVHTDAVPDTAALGCFWGLCDDHPIKTMRAEWVEQKSERTRETACLTMLELLRANRGQRVTLTVPADTLPASLLSAPPGADRAAATAADGAARSVSGTLVEVPELPPAPSPAGTAGEPPELNSVSYRPHHAAAAPQPGAAPTPGETVRELVPRGGQFVVLELDNHDRIVLPVAGVRTLSGPKITTRMERREEVVQSSKRLTIELGKEAAGQPVEMRIFYFALGLRWIPTYRLSGDLEDSGVLSLQGELLNELEDISSAELDLVVGVPNFRFKTLVSPLTLERTMRDALAQAAPDLMGRGGQQQFSNVMFQQRAGEWRGQGEEGSPASPQPLDLGPDVVAGAEQDLFVYSAGRVSLPKGARLTVPLWTSPASVRHLYTLDEHVVRNAHTGGKVWAPPTPYGPAGTAPASASPLRLARNQVWHQLELTNRSGVPWTTGATLLLRDNVPLGQELLTYTPVGGTALLPVTVAMEVRGAHDEVELERQANALHWGNYDYSKVKKQGTITLKSFRMEISQVRVTIALGGKVEQASDDGKILINDYQPEDWQEGEYSRVNNHSDVTWEFALEPGEAKTLTYVCHFYVR